MKTLWNALSFLAVAHLLAILMFAMWLWVTDRLSIERFEEVRAIFAPSIFEARATAEQAERDAEAARLAELEEERRLDPPPSTDARLQRIARLEEIESRALRRMVDERNVLAGQLEQSLVRLKQREAEFDTRRRAWEESLKSESERRASEQFAKAVRQYESVPPRQGKNMILELIDGGGMDQAVAYLDAMSARAASRILTEFRTEPEIQLATKLLERLRTFGVPEWEPTESQEPSHASGNVADAR